MCPDELNVIQYLGNLAIGKTALWCYFIWYLVTVGYYFDPDISIWLNSVGVSLIVGIGLNLSVARGKGVTRDSWQTFRLVIPPRLSQLWMSAGTCVAFIALVYLVKLKRRLKGPK
ncbi:hypothetical protein EZI54_20320 [Marinobacter halodurans]|uniref:Uncharacterized protein n=1 Tax=Marinobacter halodurans TaxID=2528979 RepID=A0ABY1ZF00_9GAMM|nr:hypothetical protein [Marinobacter halodurans]TBW49120.1 hypothetical protein EZI54_20320 [Marinobacter halodurans]